MLSQVSFNKRVSIVIACCIILPVVLIFVILLDFKISSTNQKYEAFLKNIIDTSEDSINAIVSDTRQKATFVTNYSELNNMLSLSEEQEIDVELIEKNNNINSVMNALFAVSGVESATIYTTNPNTPNLSAIKHINSDTLNNISDYNTDSWRLEHNTLGSKLHYYKKYEVTPQYYNIIQITIPFKNVVKCFSQAEHDDVYIKAGNIIFSCNDGYRFENDIPKNYSFAVFDRIEELGLDVSVYMDKSVINREIGIFAFCFFAILLIFICVIYLISNWISSKLLKEVTDIVESINLNNIDDIKATKFKSKETDIIKNHLIKLQEELVQRNEENLSFELAVLAERISPHFLYNNLSAIADCCSDDRGRKAVQLLVSYYRHVFQKGTQTTTVLNEIENGIEYLHLMSFSYDRKFEINYEIEEGCENYLMLSNIIQPILENAFIHGINDKEDDFEASIDIKASRKDDDLFVKVTDNCGNLDKDNYEWSKRETTKMHALKIIKRRIKLFYKQDKYGVEILGDKEKTEVILRLAIMQ